MSALRDYSYRPGERLPQCDVGFCTHPATGWKWARYSNGEPIGWLAACKCCHAARYILAA